MSDITLRPSRRLWTALWNDWAGRTGLLMLGLLCLVAWLSLAFWPGSEPTDWGMQAGQWAHPLGTDGLGRDFLLEVLHALGSALWVSLAAGLVGCLVGLVFGQAQVVLGRPAEILVQLLGATTRGLSAPFLPLLAFLAFPVHELVPILVFGLLIWPMLAQRVYGIAQQRWMSHAALASRALGRQTWGISTRHILFPAVASLLAVLPGLVALALAGFVAVDALGLIAPLRISGLADLLFALDDPSASNLPAAPATMLSAWIGLVWTLLGLILLELGIRRAQAETDRRPQILPIADLHLDLKPGQTVTILGGEETGKTSLALAALGLIELKWEGVDQARRVQQLANQLNWMGEDLLSASPDRHTSLRGPSVRMLVQQAHDLLPQADSVNELLGQLRLDQGQGARAMERLGLILTQGELAGTPGDLTRAQRQLIALASLLAQNTGLLILDEPFVRLSPIEQRCVESTLLESVAEGMGLLVLTRDPEVARRLGGHVVLLGQGRVSEEGPVEEFLRPGTTELAQALSPDIAPVVGAAGQRNVFVDVRLLTISTRPSRWALRPRPGRVVHAANFVASRAETLAILGGEGSGRHELAWALLAIDRAGMSGQIRLESQDLLRLTPAQLRLERPRLQLVMADAQSALAPHRTVLDSLTEGLTLVFPQLSGVERLDRCKEVLKLVDLPASCLAAYPMDLARLDRQKLSLARAVLVEPLAVVMMDPTQDLGLQAQQAFFDAVVQVQQAMSIAFILSTNDFRLTRRVAHRVLVMRQGSIVEFGPVDHVFGQPRQEMTQLFLDAAFPDLRLSSTR